MLFGMPALLTLSCIPKEMSDKGEPFVQGGFG